MNDFESRLRSLTFREPPPGWRASILAATESSPSRWSSWLAPHPAAWVALAAVWMFLGLGSYLVDDSPMAAPMASEMGRPHPVQEPTLLAFHLQSKESSDLCTIQ